MDNARKKDEGTGLPVELRRVVRRLDFLYNHSDFLRVITEGEEALGQYPHSADVVGILARAHAAAWSLHGDRVDASAAARYLRRLAELSPDMGIKRRALQHAREFEAIADRSFV